jgi:hypothetical protein
MEEAVHNVRTPTTRQHRLPRKHTTKIPHSLKSLQYPQRCVEMGLTSLTKRCDLIRMFKFENDIEEINLSEYHHYTATGNASAEES